MVGGSSYHVSLYMKFAREYAYEYSCSQRRIYMQFFSDYYSYIYIFTKFTPFKSLIIILKVYTYATKQTHPVSNLLQA